MLSEQQERRQRKQVKRFEKYRRPANEFLPFFPYSPPVFNSLTLNHVDYIKGMSLFREIYFLERRNSFASP